MVVITKAVVACGRWQIMVIVTKNVVALATPKVQWTKVNYSKPLTSIPTKTFDYFRNQLELLIFLATM